MLFDVTDFKWKPHYIQVVRRIFLGESKTAIGMDLGISVNTIDKIIESDRGQQVFMSLEENTIDTMREVQATAQSVAMEAIHEKINIMRNSGNEQLRNRAATELLALAGHTPTQRVELTKKDAITDKYKDKSELDLRRELLSMLNNPNTNSTSTATPPEAADSGDKGPDGGLLN